jgi:hypothetical protein
MILNTRYTIKIGWFRPDNRRREFEQKMENKKTSPA